MSLFGELDAAEISTNPFYVEAGEYSGKIVEAKHTEDRDGNPRFQIRYVITDEMSDYHGKTLMDSFKLFPGMTSELLATLPPAEKKEVRDALGALKRRLCGQENVEDDKGLGVLEEELNDEEWDPKTLVDMEVELAVVNSADNTRSFVRWARKV